MVGEAVYVVDVGADAAGGELVEPEMALDEAETVEDFGVADVQPESCNVRRIVREEAGHFVDRGELVVVVAVFEAERDAGNIDDETYATLHDDYTARAASVIRSLRDGTATMTNSAAATARGLPAQR